MVAAGTPHVLVAGSVHEALGSAERLCDRFRRVGFVVSRAEIPERALQRIADGRGDVLVVTNDAAAVEDLVSAARAEGLPCCVVGDAPPRREDENVVSYPPTGPKPVAGLIGVVSECLAADERPVPTGDPWESTALPEAETDGTALSTARVLDEAPVGITISDVRRPDNPLVYVNAQFVEQTGYDREAALGRNCRFLQGPRTEERPVARMREAIRAGESVTVELRNYDRSGDLFWQEVSLAPIRDATGTITHYAGFQADITRRKRAERAAERHRAELAEERESLQSLLNRLDGVVEQVTGAVVTAEDRPELGRAVCDRLGDAYAAAWLGTYDPAEERIEPEWTAAASLSDDPGNSLGHVSLRGDRLAAGGGTAAGVEEAARPEPALLTEAVESQTVTVATDVDWGPAVSDVAAVPVTYRDTVFGLFCVYTDEATTFGREEPSVLAAIGRTVGIGLNAIDSRSSLTTDAGVEVAFTVGASSLPLQQLAERTGCTLREAGVVPDGDERAVLCTVDDATASDVRAAADSVPGVRSADCIAERDSDPLFAFGLADLPLVDAVGDHGLRLADFHVDGSGVTVVARGSRETAARALVDELRATYGSVDIRRFGERSNRKTTLTEFVSDVEQRLTDRQHRVLTTAVAAGYFEWPRETDGDELADAFGVARSTFHQHLRAALRKLVEAFEDAVEPVGPRT
ncbi:MAG: bacterio-opsin activator domain-containing protein [Halobacteriaceae archaeon]